MLTIVASRDGEILSADSMRDHDKAIQSFETIIDLGVEGIKEEDKLNNVVTAPTPEYVEKAKKDRLFEYQGFRLALIES